MASIKHSILALGTTALTLTTTCLSAHSPAIAGQGIPCEQGDRLGRIALQSTHNNRFLEARGNNKRLKAKERQTPRAGSWGSFDVYVVGGNVNDGFLYALRSSKDPSRWATIERNDNKLKLQARRCTSTTTSKLFKASGSAQQFSLQSLKNNRWIGVDDNKKLVAKYRNANGRTELLMVELGQGAGQGSGQGATRSSQFAIAGTWVGRRGEKTYVYQVQQNSDRTKLRMIQFVHMGNGDLVGPVREFTGTLSDQSNREEQFRGEWRHSCNSQRMAQTVLYRSTDVLLSATQGNGAVPVSQRTTRTPRSITPAC